MYIYIYIYIWGPVSIYALCGWLMLFNNFWPKLPQLGAQKSTLYATSLRHRHQAF